jgi:hypothetical protein
LKKEDYVYLKYEDLKDKNKQVTVLRDMLQFLRLGDVDNEERLRCAFVLAENRQAHRSVDPSVVMTKEQAYLPEIACRMWALFGNYASAHGYHVWANYTCSGGFPKIPRVNVGSNGEYDRLWVKPGEKLLDFRTADTIDRLNKESRTLSHGTGLDKSVDSEGPFDEIRRRKKRDRKSVGRLQKSNLNGIEN